MDAENLLAKLAHPLPRSAVRPEKTALVIVDMQYLDADPNWGLGRRAKELGITDHLAPTLSGCAESRKEFVGSVGRSAKVGAR